MRPRREHVRRHASQGILNEVWKNKLIFVETPDANETSIALENYRRVRPLPLLGVANTLSFAYGRRATTAAVPCFSRSRAARYPKALISITITDALSSCSGELGELRKYWSLLTQASKVFRISILRAES